MEPKRKNRVERNPKGKHIARIKQWYNTDDRQTEAFNRMRVLTFILFLSVVLTVWTGMHLLVYSRITHLLLLSGRTRLALKTALVLLALSVVLGRVFSVWLQSHLLMDLSYIWMGVLAALFFLLLLVWPINLWKPQWNSGAAWTALALTLLISVAGAINYARGPVLERIGLNTALPLKESVKIVQLSDLHIERNSSLNWVRRIVDETLSQNPDLIVITGDILEESLPVDSPITAEFSRLKARLGVFAVTGNHEVYTGIHHVESFLKASGINLLRNQRMDLADRVTLIGFDDDEIGRGVAGFGEHRLTLLENLDPGRYNILLYHRPTGFDVHTAKGVHLQLSGHTHAGQTLPMNIIVQFYYRYPQGLHQSDKGSIYVSRGTGIWGPPMRFPFRSELTLLTISKAID
jgi:predicted MPP superfamily phosphohydrolase